MTIVMALRAGAADDARHERIAGARCRHGGATMKAVLERIHADHERFERLLRVTEDELRVLGGPANRTTKCCATCSIT